MFSPVNSAEKIQSIILSDVNGTNHDIIKESYNQPIILVRYLGASCSKCLHQLNLLNAISDSLKMQNIKVIGFSNDDATQNLKIMKQAKFKNTAVTLYSDKDSKVSEMLGATINEINGERTELHSTLLIYKGEILFSNIDSKPFMRIYEIFNQAVLAKNSN
jgi:peroxiredoxin